MCNVGDFFVKEFAEKKDFFQAVPANGCSMGGNS